MRWCPQVVDFDAVTIVEISAGTAMTVAISGDEETAAAQNVDESGRNTGASEHGVELVVVTRR